jgi:hypothetical protein
MLADKTLLSVTLAATFASGAFVGFAARGDAAARRLAPTDPAVVYAPQLAELERRGYDAAEMKEAREVYTDYLRAYEYQWNVFLDMETKNLDGVERKREKRLDALDLKFRERTGAK